MFFYKKKMLYVVLYIFLMETETLLEGQLFSLLFSNIFLWEKNTKKLKKKNNRRVFPVKPENHGHGI